MALKPLKIAWFSRFNTDKNPKSNSTSAYFSDVLIPILQNEFEIDLYGKEEGRLNDQRIRHFLSAIRHHSESPYDLFFYQLEDTSEANFIRMHLGAFPGVTLFHDVLFKSEGPPPLTFGVWPELLHAFNHGLCKVDIEKYGQPDRGPVAYRELSLSPFSLFSSSRLCGEARRLVPESLGRIPSTLGENKLYLPTPVHISKESSRVTRLDSTFRIGFAGSPGFENRAIKVLEAMREVPGELIWLLKQSEIPRAKELATDAGITRVTFLEGESPDSWSRIIPTLDVGIHTFFSVYGTPGPYLPITLSAGVPAIVTDFGEGELLPDEVALKIEPGHSEVLSLRENLITLSKLSEENRKVIGSAAREYAIENYSAPIVARELCHVLNRAASELKGFYSRWQEVGSWGRSQVISTNLHSYESSVVEPTFKEYGWMKQL